MQVVYVSPSNCPWTRPATRREGAWIQIYSGLNADDECGVVPYFSSIGWGPDRVGSPREGATPDTLVLFLARLLAGAFACERGLHSLLFAGLQVKGVSLDLLDDVFLLHLTLKTAKRVLEGFPLLKSYFCQMNTPPNPSGRTR
jgi:hypothetical protein